MNNLNAALISLQLAGQLPFQPATPLDERLWADNPSPFTFSLPHSGRTYTPEFIESSRLDLINLRSSEDAYVDELFADIAALGGNKLTAQFPRAYVDVNRYEIDLDPALFIEDIPTFNRANQNLINAGIGVIARVAGHRQNIYPGKIPLKQAQMRLKQHYLPYHYILNGLLQSAQAKFGYALLIDAHSMPAFFSSNQPAPDIIIGNLHGLSCHSEISNLIFENLANAGLRVKFNQPYAGGTITQKYNDTINGYHSLQIEINRGLYMHENLLEKTSGFVLVQKILHNLTRDILNIDAKLLLPQHYQAAE